MLYKIDTLKKKILIINVYPRTYLHKGTKYCVRVLDLYDDFIVYN